MTIRRAAPGDVADILRLIRALALYEHEPEAVEATEAGLAAALFGETPRVFAHIAEEAGRVVGLALWFFTFSTWTGRHGLYLEDLFVEPDMRGRGIARALFEAMAAEAAANDCARLEWSVLAWNEDAKSVYRALGARHMTDWEPWRLDDAALGALIAAGDIRSA